MIIKCPFCNADIPGFYWGSSVPYYERLAYCSSCGEAYPWTEAAVKAAKEFAKELFAEEDRNQFADVIENLVRETPRTPLAVERVKKVFGEGWASSIGDILQNHDRRDE
jgi:hypothetical protein